VPQVVEGGFIRHGGCVFFDGFTSAKLVIFVKSKKPKKHNDLKNSEKFKTKVHF
jgi:hypothetical protein